MHTYTLKSDTYTCVLAHTQYTPIITSPTSSDPTACSSGPAGGWPGPAGDPAGGWLVARLVVGPAGGPAGGWLVARLVARLVVGPAGGCSSKVVVLGRA